jgi:aarF domain-containing kinase
MKLHLAAASLSATITTVAYKAHCDSDIPVFVPPEPVKEELLIATSSLQAIVLDEDEEVVDNSYWGYFVRQAKQALTNMSHGVRYVERILTYLVVGAPLAGLVPAQYVLGSTFPELENVTYGYLVWAIQRLGPCFIKMAQWASSRPDLFPPKLIERIEKFQDDVQISYPMSVIENTLRDAFGDDWKTKIVLETKPLGTGSVAQVFQGLLKTAGASTEGIKVAIKMIHPHVEELVRTDMELLTMFATWVDKMPSMEVFAFGDTVKDFATCMNQQLDLRLEASHLVKFTKKFANEKWALFPKPVEGFVTRNVMVETLMEGTPINYFMNLPADVGSATHKLKMKLSDLGARLVLKMVFFDNYIHGDLHPGLFIYICLQ